MISKQRSRTTYTVLNFISSLGGQFLSVLLLFVVRTVFISTLGKSYLGINGLFSNILSMLSLAELGIGSAILFKLYEPIAKNDYTRIQILMQFYKTVYRFIGFVILVIGIFLVPFLPYLVKGYEKLAALNINAVFIFSLYLLQSASSYFFFAYKSAIIKANQKGYIVTIVQYVATVIGSIAQIICLRILGSFTIYVIILILQTILQNVFTAIAANKLYPYITIQPEKKLSKSEAVGIFKDCGALFLFKLNQVVIKATDNIVISAFLGLEMVGVYSNYYIFYNTINTFFNKIFDSVVHSLGNLHASSSTDHEYQIFEGANLVTAILGATAGVGIYVCSDELIRVWIGADWIIPFPFAILMGIETYTLAFRKILGRYRNAMGLFQQAKWRPLAGMIINIIVSIGLVNVWGVCGVLVGTIAADWSTYMWYDPLIINKYGFNNLYSIWRYYLKFLKYFGIACSIGYIDYLFCNQFFTGYGWTSVMIHAMICAITVPAIFVLLHSGSAEGQYIIKLIKQYRNKLLRK